MKINIRLFIVLFSFAMLYGAYANGEKKLKLNSPSGNLEVEISIDSIITWSLTQRGNLLIKPSKISMTLGDGVVWGKSPKLKQAKQSIHNNTIHPPIYFKDNITDRYNELTLKFREKFNIIFRAYDDGVAYQFVSRRSDSFVVNNEDVNFNFPGDPNSYYAYPRGRSNGNKVDSFYTAFQSTYNHTRMSSWEKGTYAFLPVLIESESGEKLVITESDLIDYPGLYLKHTAHQDLESVFPGYPKKVVRDNMDGVVKSRESYIAKRNGKGNFPWRVVVVANESKELLNNDLVYKLATPPQFDDFSWIKPGKVAWDWWNNWGIYGVDFKAGVNNKTYKYYIDFASAHGIRYVIMDEGWAVDGKADLFQVVPEINLQKIIDYARSKDVGIILWAGFKAFDKDLDKICSHFAAMGVKGFKLDFMNRDDQYLNNFLYRAAKATAKYHLLIDFHGTAKPTGLNRTFPNVINYEGVYGLEETKWAKDGANIVDYDVTMPFIRMLAGPIDFTQGAMRNAAKDNFRAVYSEPMSPGTRCRQLAEYVIFNSPLNMLCDAPTNYMHEKECTEFISDIPTVWDETIPLKADISQYIAMARRNGATWYVGGLTNWNARDIKLNFSFLSPGKYKVVLFRDGENADKIAKDYKKKVVKVTAPLHQDLKIHLAPGGGFSMKITQE